MSSLWDFGSNVRATRCATARPQVLINLLVFLPCVAISLRPGFVTDPIVEIIGDRGVTAAGLVRIRRHGNWTDSFRFDACRSVTHARKSRRGFAVAHLGRLRSVSDARSRAQSSTGTVPQAGGYLDKHV